MSILGIVTARGGSKGLRRKNLASLAGKPLLTYTIEAALGSKHLDRVVLTSEDMEIIQVARAAGCDVPFIRPEHLAADDTPHAPVITHALEAVNHSYDYFVLLQPTSPLRTSEDIDACIETCVRRKAPVAVSVNEFGKNPAAIVALDSDARVHSLLRAPATEGPRQKSVAYVLNGAVYVCRCDWWKAHERFLGEGTVGYVMPADRSIDIDDERDLGTAAALLAAPKRGQ
jgi:CMP-N,N'-diacetyllegionaminic acid synthase